MENCLNKKLLSLVLSFPRRLSYSKRLTDKRNLGGADIVHCSPNDYSKICFLIIFATVAIEKKSGISINVNG